MFSKLNKRNVCAAVFRILQDENREPGPVTKYVLTKAELAEVEKRVVAKYGDVKPKEKMPTGLGMCEKKWRNRKPANHQSMV